ncbi:MAG: hypothetical protein HGB36_13250 [Chlorobiaceae bacterium]|nr:hypothetical protein [Chlorobiaceae bacterium]
MVVKNLARVCGFLALLLTLAGCLEVSTVVHVKPDGSGTVSERILISREAFSQMKPVEGKDKNDQPGKVPDKTRIEKKTREMGEGVTFVDVHPVETKSHEGYETVYAFRDINQLKISRNPDTESTADSSAGTASIKKNRQYVKFVFSKGEPSKLKILMDQEPGEKTQSATSPATPPADPEQQKMMADLMKQFFKGMRVFLAVDVDGSLVSTNATHRSGKRITLVDVNFDKLIAHPRQFAAFNASGSGASTQQMEKIMKNITGIRVEGRKEVDVIIK